MGLDLHLFEKGGLVMYLLAAISIYSLGVILFKAYQFWRANLFDRSFIEPALREIKQGDRVKATRALADIPGPIAKIMRVTFECVSNRDMSKQSKEAEIVRVGSGDIRYLESHMRGLEMVSSIAPLLGLFGTVVGMINSFSKLGMGTRVDPTVLAGGIWEALLTTAGGLAVAIPALAAHYIIDGIIERVRATMKDVSVQILALEDEFNRNERLLVVEEERRREEERRMREEQDRMEREWERQERERERYERELERQEREARDAREAAEREAREAREAAEREEAKNRVTTPQSSATLRLLNPSYNQL